MHIFHLQYDWMLAVLSLNECAIFQEPHWREIQQTTDACNVGVPIRLRFAAVHHNRKLMMVKYHLECQDASVHDEQIGEK